MSLSAKGGTTPYTYIWDDSGNQTNFIATGLTGINSYSVILTDANACNFSASNLAVNLKKGQRKDHGGIRVYPNPAKEQFIVDLSSIRLNNYCRIEVSDIKGQKTYNKQLQNSTRNVAINSKKWDIGIYIISIYCQNSVIYSDKIILTK